MSRGTWANIKIIQSWIVSVYTFSKIHCQGLGSFDDDDRHTVAPVFHSRHRLFDVQLDVADNQLHKKRMTFLFGWKHQWMVVRTHWCREGCVFCMKSACVIRSTPLDEIMQHGRIAMQNVSLDTSITLSSAYTDQKKWRWRRILHIVED